MYATVEQLKTRLGNAYAEFYADDVEAAADLAAASAEIDGVMAARYIVPVTADAALAMLANWNLTLAEEMAWGDPDAGDKIPEKIARRIDRVRKLLDRVPDGDFTLPGATETTYGNGGVALIDIAEPVFTRDKMRGF